MSLRIRLRTKRRKILRSRLEILRREEWLATPLKERLAAFRDPKIQRMLLDSIVENCPMANLVNRSFESLPFDSKVDPANAFDNRRFYSDEEFFIPVKSQE